MTCIRKSGVNPGMHVISAGQSVTCQSSNPIDLIFGAAWTCHIAQRRCWVIVCEPSHPQCMGLLKYLALLWAPPPASAIRAELQDHDTGGLNSKSCAFTGQMRCTSADVCSFTWLRAAADSNTFCSACCIQSASRAFQGLQFLASCTSNLQLRCQHHEPPQMVKLTHHHAPLP